MEVKWYKSSDSSVGESVEWAFPPGAVWVRKSGEDQHLEFTELEWQAFIAGANRGEADLPRA